MKTSVSSLLVMALFGLVGVAGASTVYTWKGQSGQSVYSDVPRNLNTNNISTMNVRSQTVTQIPSAVPQGSSTGGQIGTQAAKGTEDGGSLHEQQAALNAKMAAENQRRDEENKKIEEQNKQMRAENCTRAKINLQNVQTSNRVNNRESLEAGYKNDIEKFCG